MTHPPTTPGDAPPQGLGAAVRQRVVAVCVGTARPMVHAGRRVMTAIAKTALEGTVTVHPQGLAGDEQADPTVHGGLSKAVYAYPAEHLRFWQTVRAQARVSLWDDPLPPGSMGENLLIAGVLERDLWIGDLLRFPDCVLVVSEPRSPCFKFNAAMGFAQASKLMVQSGFCGAYLAVRQPGTIAAGQPFELVPGPREVGLAELFRARHAGRHD